MPKIKIVVDEDLCIGAASCVTVAADYFQMNEKNKAVVLDPDDGDEEPTYERELDVPKEELEKLILAAESCPTYAVFIYDEDGAQIFPKVD
jgi:ferredoxin